MKNMCRYPLDPLVEIMARLRGEHGCPWDKQQTHETLKPYLVEEAYEVMDAVDRGDMEALCEELGDVVLQAVYHAEIASENGEFDMNDVIRKISEKMIRRHPHVFAGVVVKDAKGVLENWEKIKMQEKAGSLLDEVPRCLPALMRAHKIQTKASRVGFDWNDPRDAIRKISEESQEFQAAYESGDHTRMADELGDMLFAIVNVARLLDVDPELILHRSVDKFSARFRHIERRAGELGRGIGEMTLTEMDDLWEEAKSQE